MASSNEEFNSDNSFSSLTGTGNQNIALGTDGPSDSRCPICLERIRNVAFLNPCFHRFCFACILEWSDRKAECPLCKQCFNSFFHTIRSDTDFEEYIVPFENASFGMCGERSAQRPETLPDNGVLYQGYSDLQSQSRMRSFDELMRQLSIRRSSHPGGISLGQIREQVTIKFRRALYRSGVRVRNVQSGGFYRDISADFFHRNPVRLNRLVPWLKRELRVLCGTHAFLIQNIQHIVLNNITIYDLDSQSFADIMQPHLLHYTNHFLHEFINFARSPFNIKAYDWRASYDIPYPMHDDGFQSYSSFTTSSSEEEEEEEEEEGETEDSDENAGEEGESVTSNEEGTWDDEIQGSTSSSSDQALDEFFLPFGSSNGELLRSGDNMHVFFQADAHLGTHNRHCLLHKCVLDQIEESTPMLCKSIPNCMESAEHNVDDDEEEELGDEQEALRSHSFGGCTHSHSNAGSAVSTIALLNSNNQMFNALQVPSQEQETNSMDQTTMPHQDTLSTKLIHHKGEDIIVIEIMRPLHKEFKPRTGFRSLGEGSLVKTMPLSMAKSSKCAICLGGIQDTTYLNPCNHKVCFDCIQKWSRKKVICPLCKQRFHSFFHTVSTKGAFCEYVLPLNDGSFSHSESRESLTSPPDNGIVHDEIRGMLTQRERDIYQLMRQFAVTKRPTNKGVISLGKFKAQAVIQFRRALYRTGILVQNAPNPDFKRIASAEFLSRNPGGFDRLIPWLKRELKVLCGNQRPMIHTLQSFILNKMMQHDLQSKEFEALLRPHLRHFTTHFLHEFISFVQSPFSVKKYDWNASYECPTLTREDSDSFTSSGSSDEEHSLLPDNDQATKANSNLDDGSLGCFNSGSEKDITVVSTTADVTNHKNNEGNDLEDLSNSDSEKGRYTADKFLKNKLLKLQPDKRAQTFGSFSPAQLLQCKEESEDLRELQPVETHSSKNAEASKNALNLLASGDNNYKAFSSNHSDVAEINSIQNSTKEEATTWQQVDSPTRNLRSSSSERFTTLSPNRKSVLKKSGSRGMGYHSEEGYSAPKGRHGGKGRRRHPHEEKQCTNYSRDKRHKREQRKSKSRDASLFLWSTLPLRSESIVARDTNKPKSQNTHHFRKPRSKDYDCLRNRVSSEPNCRYLYYRQDSERYRYEEPLYSKGESARVYGSNPLDNCRERLFSSPENRISDNQERLAKGWYHYSERCRTTGRPRGRCVVVGQEGGLCDKLGGKRRHKSHHMEPGHSRGGLR
ncbi:E3 ubiquitin-protein ligase Topors-like [Elgaria multicarinata webbii]|uniref:E3 ubiquitin-protein ligase Topors-like n=1 Tax=Elgaria multicarinata webbii TaxID=159646 RepID=UPI002FCD4E63